MKKLLCMFAVVFSLLMVNFSSASAADVWAFYNSREGVNVYVVTDTAQTNGEGTLYTVNCKDVFSDGSYAMNKWRFSYKQWPSGNREWCYYYTRNWEAMHDMPFDPNGDGGISKVFQIARQYAR